MLYTIVGYYGHPIRMHQKLKGCLRFSKIIFRYIGVLLMCAGNSIALLFYLAFLLCPGSFQTLRGSI